MFINLQHTFPPFQLKRIISLVPSITETLSDLGLENEVAAITKFCVHPSSWFKNKPRVGGTKNVSIKMIHELKPDLIISNKEENEKKQVDELAEFYNVLLTDIYDLDSALHMIQDIGMLVNRNEQASHLVNEIKSRFDELKPQFKKKKKSKAAYFIWQNPYMVSGGNTFINNMMLWCGLQNIFSSSERYPEIGLEEIRERRCEIILLSSEPYPFIEKHKREMEGKLPGIKIYLVDGEMFSWYGSRLLKAPRYFKSFSCL